ncbi:APC family permease [Leptolyngbya sp. NIES-2104]|uniref:APC family permease n=1 Tax=Leptolyngbya sp. NIES-2104 TaxID=1552121 RepID=UPI0006EC896F|nr:amino acid permease [Leptolyngbya sp. NIES-2104]GAP96867.1 amino acid transporter [Leptolyngbya sp. NIES-2104]
MDKLHSPTSPVIQSTTAPKPTLGFVDAVALIVGVVIGAGIFETPALVAASSGNATSLILAWVAGGGISLIGALCFAELATAYPNAGGNYYYLKRAFGYKIAFLFSWARMVVIQPGSIVLLAFVLGDYATQLLPLGAYSSSLYAIATVALFTGLNLLGIRQGKGTQNALAIVELLGLLLIIAVGLVWTPSNPAATSVEPAASTNWGSILIFVLLSYGGWNEAAYISAELRQIERNMVRSLLWSIGIISTVYVLLNLAYLHGMGLSAMAQSDAIAADLMRQALGEPGARLISVLVAIAALSSINATILTGARTNYALGRDFPLFSVLGRWHSESNTPTSALLVQGAIASVLVLLATLQRQGFEAMVDYTAPVFWFFFLLTGLSLFVLRKREPHILRPFQVPFYPVIPFLFCLVCGYMLYSSLSFTGVGALVGVAALLAGIPVLLIARRSMV